MRFNISHNGKIVGDFSFMEVVAALSQDRFSSSDFFWTKGMKDWQPLSSFADFNASLPDQSVIKPAPAPAPVTPRRSAEHAVAAEPHCPSCNSKTVQACGMGFASGTRRSESLGISSRGRTYYRTGRSSSILASALAPPQKEGVSMIFVLMLLGGLFGCAVWYAKYASGYSSPFNQGEKWLGLLLAIGATAGGLWGISADSARTSQEHAGAMAKWNKQWYCKKCGSIFIPNLGHEE
jgi:hypothetical protein